MRRECCPVCEVGAVKLGQRDALTNDCATITSGFHEATSLLDAERMREDRDISNFWKREEGVSMICKLDGRQSTVVSVFNKNSSSQSSRRV